MTGDDLRHYRLKVFDATQGGMALLLDISLRKYQQLEAAEKLPYRDALVVHGLMALRPTIMEAIKEDRRNRRKRKGRDDL